MRREKEAHNLKKGSETTEEDNNDDERKNLKWWKH